MRDIPQISRRDAVALGATGAVGLAVGPKVLADGAPASAAAAAATQPGVYAGDIWSPYIAVGTVLTRVVSSMPLATNSAAMAQRMLALPTNNFGVVTSINTRAYNIPVYVVDSTVVGCPTARMTVTRAPAGSTLAAKLNGVIPIPTWAEAAGGGDKSMAVYDRGTGVMREYFYCDRQTDGSWTAGYGGYYVAQKNLSKLSTTNYSMQLTEGSSAVVAMLSPLMQVSVSEARAGLIKHALGFTIANARAGVTSWPAKQNDGTDSNVNSPAEGQWFRLPPTLDVDSLGLKPFTLLLAKAAQKYGGMATDKNLFCHAFNCEPGITTMHREGSSVDPWDGDIKAKYGNLDVNDFPWALTQWARVGWGKPAA